MPFSMCLFSLMTDCSELSILSFIREISSRSAAIGGGAAWMFSKRTSSLNSSPCLECGFVGRLFSFAGSACSALLLAGASVLVVVSSLLVVTPR